MIVKPPPMLMAEAATAVQARACTDGKLGTGLAQLEHQVSDRADVKGVLAVGT